ncbi:type II 3-dehydroquinate dehydratase [Candidatus Vidania fulgoroideorum]
MKIKIINGPNINLLGYRQKKIYGTKSVKYIKKYIKKYITKKKLSVKIFNYNSESKIIKEIHKSANKTNYFIINLAAFSYYSVAILDALLAVKISYIEVHISNIFKREKFRAKSIFKTNSEGFISGMGIYGYVLALKYILYLNAK